MNAEVFFGFGQVLGEIVIELEAKAASSARSGMVVIVDQISTLRSEDIGAGWVAIVSREPVSLYSHAASSIWRLGRPVVTGVHTERLVAGTPILLDFEARRCEIGVLKGSERAVSQGSEKGPRLTVLSEVEGCYDFDDALCGDGLAVIDIEDAWRIGRAKIGEFLGRVRGRWVTDPAIRFFDVHPDRGQIAGKMGFRGGRVVSRDTIDRFCRIVDELDLDSEPVVVLPMYAHHWEFERFAELISPLTSRVGVTVECPEAALGIERIISECSLVEIGLNDLSQFTMAWDRDIPNAETMPMVRLCSGVASLIGSVVRVAGDAKVHCSLGLDLKPSVELLKQMSSLGVGAISCPSVLSKHWKVLMMEPAR